MQIPRHRWRSELDYFLKDWSLYAVHGQQWKYQQQWDRVGWQLIIVFHILHTYREIIITKSRIPFFGKNEQFVKFISKNFKIAINNRIYLLNAKNKNSHLLAQKSDSSFNPRYKITLWKSKLTRVTTIIKKIKRYIIIINGIFESHLFMYSNTN